MTDPVLWHALHRLADYPALASLAQGRTAATKLKRSEIKKEEEAR